MTRKEKIAAEESMKLPPGKTCDDCVHARRCFGIGYSTPGRTQCDFYPNKFQQR